MKLTNMEALQAQKALSGLMELDLPVKVSLDIALISNMVDEQVKAFSRVRDKLFNTYSIKTEPCNPDGSIKFVSTIEGETEEATGKLRAENLEAFGEKFSDLLEAKTGDLVFSKIQLPEGIIIKPSVLKALTGFVEIK